MFAKLFGRTKRTLNFAITLVIHELTQVPLNNSIVFVKWKVLAVDSFRDSCDRMQDGKGASGYTSARSVDMHAALWDEEFALTCALTVDEETDTLDPYCLRLSVRKVVSTVHFFVHPSCAGSGSRKELRTIRDSDC